MTVDQIAHAFAAGQLTVRTPLWPPGTSGWQALGNFEQFQHSGAFPATGASGGMPQQPAYGQLSQFEEADDDPTRMWTGNGDYPELSGADGMAMDPPPPAPPVPPQRASARTGPRQVSSRPVARSAPPAPAPVSRTASVSPAAPVFSAQPSSQFAAQSSAQFSAESQSFRPNRRRGSGVWLAAGLVGLVGLGSAVLAVRGGWSSAAPTETAAVAAAMPKPEPVSERTPTSEPSSAPEATAQAEQPAAPGNAAAEAPQAAPDAPGKAGKPAEANQAQLAKYEDSQASAFVAEGQPTQKKRVGDRKLTSKASKATRESKSDSSEAKEASKVSSAAKPKATAAAAPAAKAKPTPAAVTEIREAKTEAKPGSSPVAAAVNDAAALALGNAAKLASSCRPQGGPAGPGKARVIYSNDGEVQSVEILTAKFRDTLTGSCVRMVFRRAKIEAFKGEPPTFIKSFTIPEQ
jgi:chemotaxis protein histidine kinase CheA